MADTRPYNFDSSRAAHSQITRLFDFVSPAAIALWQLRLRVNEEIRLNPAISSDDLSRIFANGSGFRGGEIRRACADTSWNKQLESFSQIILVNAISIYEGFTADLTRKLGLQEKASRTLASNLQFPPIRVEGDVNSAIKRLNARQSTALKNVFVASSKANKNYSLQNLQNLLTCYRYFKEIRNCIVHNGSVANATTVSAFNDFTKVATVKSLGIKEVPKHHPIVLGKLVSLELRGVIGLCDVLLKLIATIDGELSESILVEEELLNRIVPLDRRVMLPADAERRRKSIRKLVIHSGFPEPKVSNAFENFLKKIGKIGPF